MKESTRYSMIGLDVAADIESRIPSDEELQALEDSLKESKFISFKKFYKQCYSDLYTIKYNIFGHLIKRLQVFQTLQVLDSSLYEYLDVYVIQEWNMFSK